MNTGRYDRLVQSTFRFLIGKDSLFPNDVDMEAALALCTHHGLLPLLGYRLRAQDQFGDILSSDYKDQIERSERQNRARNALTLGALMDAIETLQPIEPVLFKGIAAAAFWPKADLRDPGDLDLMVPRERFVEAKLALLSAGWREVPTVHGHLDDDIADKYGFARVFRHPVRPVTVDLHREPVDRTEPFRLDPDAIFAGRTRREIADGVVVCTPGDVEHLVLIALHTLRHGTFRLQGFFDLFTLYRSAQDNNRLIGINKYAKINKVFRAVSVAFACTEQLLCEPYGTLTVGSRNDSVRAAAARRRPGVLAHGHLVRHGGIRRLAALVDLVDTVEQGVRYLLRLAFPPRELTLPGKRHGILHYLVQRVSVFVNLLRRFERVEKDS